MRLIDADILEIRLANLPGMWTSWNHWKRARVIIEDMAKVDPVKHGHWIKHEQTKTEVSYEECSLCHCVYNQGGWMAYGYYCPHCGAKMDEEVMTE